MPATDRILDPTRSPIALYRTAVGFLARSQRTRVHRAGLLVAFVCALDLVGVLFVGWMVGAAYARTQSYSTLRIPLIGRVSDEVLILLGVVGIALLIIRSVVAWLLNQRIFRFLATCETDIAVDLLEKVERAPFESISALTTQAVIEGVRGGARSLIMVITNCLLSFAELALISVIAVFLLFVDPLLFLLVSLVFLATFVLHVRVTTPRIHRFNTEIAGSAVEVNRVVAEAIGLSREERLYGSRPRLQARLRLADSRFARSVADSQVWFQFPRYALELALVLSMIAMACSVALRGSTPRVVAATAIFVVASGRILPSMLRLQSSNASITAAVGLFAPAEELLSLPQTAVGTAVPLASDPARPLRPPSIHLSGVSYRYPASTHDVLHDIDLEIPAGSRTALVGSTGAGKSTLGDLLLGLLQPHSGSVEWTVEGSSGVRPAFVSQDVFLSDQTIAENVAVGIEREQIEESAVWTALRSAHVDDVVRALPDGIWSVIGERGIRLSGGQRQRLGIARALFRSPSFLVLDEATSALDASTEAGIGAVLDDLRGSVTIVVIAHRLATVRHADAVVALDDGRLLAVGTFDEVVARVPDLARNAQLQGIG